MFKIKIICASLLTLIAPKMELKPYGAVYLFVENQTPKYVVKPDQARTANAEALAYAIASAIGLSHLTPETHLSTIPIDNTQKLCSVQRYIADIETLRDLADVWLKQNLSNTEILKLIDPTDFEELFLLILLFYDTDAHANNIAVKKDTSNLYRLIKFDNGLTFPTKNKSLFNALYLLPQAQRKFSPRTIERIANLPMEKLNALFSQFEMKDALPAFQERVKILKQLTHLPMRDIDIHFRKLENGIKGTE